MRLSIQGLDMWCVFADPVAICPTILMQGLSLGIGEILWCKASYFLTWE